MNFELRKLKNFELLLKVDCFTLSKTCNGSVKSYFDDSIIVIDVSGLISYSTEYRIEYIVNNVANEFPTESGKTKVIIINLSGMCYNFFLKSIIIRLKYNLICKDGYIALIVVSVLLVLAFPPLAFVYLKRKRVILYEKYL